MPRLTWSDYGSRPTAVNLSDAAEKLRSLVLKTAETANEAQTVFQVGHGGHLYEISFWMTNNSMVLEYWYCCGLSSLRL